MVDGQEVLVTQPPAVRKKTDVDPGAHYRFEFNGVKMDPYRIALTHDVTHPIAFHMLKKILRGSRKGHSERHLVTELKDCVRRWEEILDENDDANRNDALLTQVPSAAHAACQEDGK
jgi:hypothetical protein